jgi:hypothetical protein
MFTYFDASDGKGVQMEWVFSFSFGSISSAMERSCFSKRKVQQSCHYLCYNFHKLNFNSLPLQMWEGPRCTTYSKSHPQKRRKDSFKYNQIGPQNANKRSMSKWDKCPIYFSIKQVFLAYLAGGCVLFHGFTPIQGRLT